MLNEVYKTEGRLGEGGYGQVYLVRHKKMGLLRAMKVIPVNSQHEEGKTDEEIELLKKLDHPNIVKLLSFFYTKSKKGVYLNCLMDYVPQTLSNLIHYNKYNHTKFPLILIKLFSFQMLKSIGYLNSLGICHRDIKPQNILIDPSDYTLKLCDFGCAKHLNKGEKNISYICSRYYRPPELVLGATEYTTQVDVWSMGCVIAELVTNRPLFAGKSAEDQLFEIMNILGTPSKSQILEMNPKIKEKIKLPQKNSIDWKKFFGNKINNDEFIDLVSKLLVYEPTVRLSPYEALCHPFFDELRNLDLNLPNGKKLPNHLFEFKTCEINYDKENIHFLLSQIQK